MGKRRWRQVRPPSLILNQRKAVCRQAASFQPVRFAGGFFFWLEPADGHRGVLKMRIYFFKLLVPALVAAALVMAAQEPVKPRPSSRIMTATKQVLIFTGLE